MPKTSSPIRRQLLNPHRNPPFYPRLGSVVRNNAVGATNVNPKAPSEWEGIPGRVLEFRRQYTIFSQGDPSNTVIYLREGSVKLTVVDEGGKEAVVAILGSGEFFGEASMAGQKSRTGSAIAISPTTVVMIEKDEMLRLLHTERELSEHFMTCILARNNRIEADLIDQLFNSIEKRLARTLLLLARYGTQDQPEAAGQNISQTTLAEMVGTTRPRINMFMNKFRKLGYIEYDREIKVNRSLLTVVLHE